MIWYEQFKIIWVVTNVGKRSVVDSCFDLCEYRHQLEACQNCFLDHAEHEFFIVLIILSNIFPICGATSGFKCQVVCSLDRYSLILCISMFNLLVVSFRLVQQSLHTSPDFPSLLTNLCKLPMKLPVS